MKTQILIFTLLVAFASCKSKYQKILKSSDYNAKYEAAVEYFNEDEYYKSQTLLESVAGVYRGTERAENINYYLAYCCFHQSEYIMSGYYFETFVATFVNSEKAAECQFKAGESYKAESPKPSRDQEYTNKAIEAFQMYINKYPQSGQAEQANKEIELLRKKLEKKDFDNAKLYLKVGDYKSAVIALKNCTRDFPDTEYHEEIQYNVIESSYLLALNSVESKKHERYESTVDEYYSYIDQYPNGAYAKKSEKFFEQCMKYLKNK